MACAAWWTYLEIDQTAFFFAAIEQNARDSWRYCSAGSTTVNTSEFLFWLIFPMQSSCQKMKECLITATDNIPDSYYAQSHYIKVLRCAISNSVILNLHIWTAQSCNFKKLKVYETKFSLNHPTGPKQSKFQKKSQTQDFIKRTLNMLGINSAIVMCWAGFSFAFYKCYHHFLEETRLKILL